MSEKIKVAIIGCGAIANSAHIPAYMKNEKAEIKYFCDIIPERADAAVEKYGCGKAVYDYHEILDDPELDSVSVCTHNDLHSVIASCERARMSSVKSPPLACSPRRSRCSESPMRRTEFSASACATASVTQSII